MKKIYLLQIVCLFFSCKDNEKSSISPTITLGFSLSDSNTLFQLYPRDSIKFGYTKNLIYYKSGVDKIEIQDVIISNFLQLNGPKYTFTLLGIEEMSSLHNIKNYYIHWPNGEQDTLFVDYVRDESHNNNCNCLTPLVEFTLNRKPFVSNLNGVYIFDR
jgi:hypothetical protein